MPVKIRLARRGRSKRPYYHIIVADSRSPRDGKYIEKLGIYDPLTVPATIDIQQDRALYWLTQGAQPTDTARAILSYTGVLYKKHLQRGVSKGALTQEQADAMFMDWWDAKRKKVEDHKNKVQEEKDQVASDKKAAESKIRAEKSASQQAALAPEGAASNAGDAAAATAEPTGDAIGDALSTAQADNEALLGINKDAPAEEAKVEEAAAEAPAEEPKVEETEAPAAAVEETPAPVEEAKEEVAAAAPAEEAKEETPAAAPVEAPAAAEADDLKKIEGVGPKLAEVLNAGGIQTFSQLAAKSADEVKTILESAEGNYAMHDPTTWPKQAQLAADGKWDELTALQDELDGGKETT